MTISLVLSDGAGERIHDFGDQAVDVTHAFIDGLFYAKLRRPR